MIAQLCKPGARRTMALLLLIACSSVMWGCGSTPRLLEPEPGWIYLGERNVNHWTEKDVFSIESREKFAAIKFYAYTRSVTIKKIEIKLINGDVLVPSTYPVIKAGDRSRVIELSPDGRQIERITIRYKSEGKLFSDKAILQVAGLRPQHQY